MKLQPYKEWMVLFTGSRDLAAPMLLLSMMEQLYSMLGRYKVLQGGAPGIDTNVIDTASRLNLDCQRVRPDYVRYGRYEAPKRRNIEMLEMKPDFVVGFWDGESGGTKHCLDFAINVFRIPTLVITL